jgi:hypothetical protein
MAGETAPVLILRVGAWATLKFPTEGAIASSSVAKVHAAAIRNDDFVEGGAEAASLHNVLSVAHGGG